jgi:hypothetical protein
MVPEFTTYRIQTHCAGMVVGIYSEATFEVLWNISRTEVVEIIIDGRFYSFFLCWPSLSDG